MTDTQQFFAAFAEAYNEKDAELIAANYRQPCVMMSDDKKDVYSTEAEITYYAEQLLQRFAEVGAVGHAASVMHCLRMSESVLFTQVRWEASDAEGTRLFGCCVSYTIQVDAEGGLKIMMSLLDEEDKALSELKSNE
ncbi:hypothetical protein EYS14_12325 [Alteromonadaceae bacterium M269]|nr:hypothetical protein EYS14_12325 [Alteromonadaceae bacterium M269]